jgi:hypothetical protein
MSAQASLVTKLETAVAALETPAEATYHDGVKAGVKLTVETLEAGDYGVQVVHIDEAGKDDLVAVIGAGVPLLSEQLWAVVNS